MAINRNMATGGSAANRMGPSAKSTTTRQSTLVATRRAIPTATRQATPAATGMNATPIKSPIGGRKAPVPKDTKVGKAPAVKRSPARVDGKVGRVSSRGATGSGRMMPTRDVRAELMNTYRKSGGNQR